MEEFESFTIGAQEASEILGVNRTRLSQLTSKGVFAFERRKIENRNRLFYRLNDLLNYQRQFTYGNLDAKVQFKERFLPQVREEVVVSDIVPQEVEKIERPPFSSPSPRLMVKKRNSLSTAVERKEKSALKNELEILKSKLKQIESCLLEQKQLFFLLEKHLKTQDLKLFQLSISQENKGFEARKKEPVQSKVTKKSSGFRYRKNNGKRFLKQNTPEKC